ncbi:MAG: hypothetical protein QM722_03805 [Piscinibacter sp.]
MRWPRTTCRRRYERARWLQGELPANAPVADQARAVNLLARIQTYLGETDAAAASAERAGGIARAGGDKVGEAEAELSMAIIAVNQGRIDRLVEAATRSVSLLDGAQRPDLLSEALLRLGTMYGRFGQLDDQVAFAVQAMQIAEREHHPMALVHAHQGMAIAFDMTERSEDAARHYEQMLEQAKAARSRLARGLRAARRVGPAAAAAGLTSHRSAPPSRRSSCSARSVHRSPTTSRSTAWRTCTASVASTNVHWACSIRSSRPTMPARTASASGSR